MFGTFPVSPEMFAKYEARRAQELAERLTRAVPWTPTMPWTSRLTLQASTWPAWPLLDVTPTHEADVDHEPAPATAHAYSPTRRFVFCQKVLPAGACLTTYQGPREGSVLFDGPVAIPSLHAVARDAWRGLWMSLTPMEVFSLRPGINLARGHTVVAGLGLGWTLVEALEKPAVTRVTLVERDAELVTWLLPAIRARLSPAAAAKPCDVVVGDAREVLPTLTADVALVDIFPHYGRNRLRTPCPGIRKVWCWGAALVRPR